MITGNKTRITAFLLAIILTGSVFACSNKTGETAQKNTEPVPDSVSASEEETKILPDVPAADFGGYKFTFMHWQPDTENSLRNKDLYAENLNGDTINDAVYQRNSEIESQYNIEIALQLEPWAELPNKIKKLVFSNDSSIDVYYPFGYTVGPLFTSGIFYNLKNVPYIDFSKPWWDANIVRDLTICGKLYFATTNINILDKTATSIMIFNKKMAEDYNCPNFYDLVNQNHWTIDKLGEVSKGVTSDVNGDSVMDINDVYGLVGADTFIMALYYSMGGNFTAIDSDGYPQINFMDEKTSDIFDKIFKIVYDQSIYQHIDWLGYPLAPEAVELFFTGSHSMLTWVILESLDRLRASEVDFGILPLPKFNEEQTEYHHFVSKYGTGFLSIPKCAENIERTGIILEALAGKSQYTVIPAYYDIVLKGKYSRDNESEAMLDIIFASRVYSFADIATIGTVTDTVLRCVRNSKGTPPPMASNFKKIETSFDRALKAFIKQMEKSE